MKIGVGLAIPRLFAHHFTGVEHIYPLRKNAELMGLNALGEQLDITPLCPHTPKQSQVALIPVYIFDMVRSKMSLLNHTKVWNCGELVA